MKALFLWLGGGLLWLHFLVLMIPTSAILQVEDIEITPDHRVIFTRQFPLKWLLSPRISYVEVVKNQATGEVCPPISGGPFVYHADVASVSWSLDFAENCTVSTFIWSAEWTAWVGYLPLRPYRESRNVIVIADDGAARRPHGG